ncbi:hypothetical protein [Bacillus sp. PS06]|uniref:hypothetical protein n=1 Tax=Bacillus sp. PS06 TaxID=2764176 RepID=UPI00177F5B2E|nr:hypothetical protein [Bacillus sp. PS06]MBD8068018.1 hypothetical protein [Bacillus sp. PS06]
MVENKNEVKAYSITEKLLARYYHLNELEKDIEKEMKEIKKVFHLYFDEINGQNEKGEFILGDYKVQRQIRTSENYDEEKTVLRLEKKNLNDCIRVVKKPDIQKIEAAITLGILDLNDIEDCKTQKIAKAITVRKV